MKKILQNITAIAAFLTLSTIALPAFALEVSLSEDNADEVLIVQRPRRYRRFGRYRFNEIECFTVRRTRRWLRQRCWKSICFRRGRRIRCRVVRTWRRRIPRRYRRKVWRREIPDRYRSRRVRIYNFSDD